MRPENVRSETTEILNPGRDSTITRPDSWRNLRDIKSYQKRQWILIYDIPETPAEKPVTAKKVKGRKNG